MRMLFVVLLSNSLAAKETSTKLELSQIDYRARIRQQFSLPASKLRWSFSVEKRYVPKEEEKDKEREVQARGELALF